MKNNSQNNEPTGVMKQIIARPLISFVAILLTFSVAAVVLFIAMLWFLFPEDHSTVADVLSSISNISLSVAGSLVAIVLAIWAIQQTNRTHALEEQSHQFEKEGKVREEIDVEVENFFSTLAELRVAGNKLYEQASEFSNSLGANFERCPRGSDLNGKDAAPLKEQQIKAAEALEDFARALGRAARDPLFERAAAEKAVREVNASGNASLSTFKYISQFLEEVEENQSNLIKEVNDFIKANPEGPTTTLEMDEAEDIANQEQDEESQREGAASLGAPERLVTKWAPSPEVASVSSSERIWKLNAKTLEEHAVYLLEVAESMRFTELDTYWLRQAYARYVWVVQQKAALDRKKLGAYMMQSSPDARKRLLEKSTADERKGAVEKDLRKSAFTLMQKSDPESDEGVSKDPLLRFMSFSDCVFPLTAIKGAVSSNGDVKFELPGNGVVVSDYEQLPRDPLAINYMAYMLAAAISSLPKEEDFLNAFTDEEPAKKHLKRHLKPSLLRSEIRSVMRDFSNYLNVYPDKIFMPVWPMRLNDTLRDTSFWSDFPKMAAKDSATDNPPSRGGSLRARIGRPRPRTRS